jgi:hypothetical protein
MRLTHSKIKGEYMPTKKILKKKIPQTGQYILTHPSLSPSAKVLAKGLGLQKAFEPRNYPPVIRWGNSMPGSHYITDSGMNSKEIIGICSNKLRFHSAMEALNIPHVEILSGTPDNYPIVIRHNLEGARGIGIEIDSDGSIFNTQRGRVYWSYWRNFSTEFGVHFFNGEIIRAFRKIREEGQGEERFPIRNSERGYKFSLVDLVSNPKPKLSELLQNFINKFGMMYGRIDVGWNADSHIWEIIEANSAPSLAENENTASLYIEKFRQLLQGRR